MPASGRFFIPPSILETFANIYLGGINTGMNGNGSNGNNLAGSGAKKADALGILIRLCDKADFRKHSESRRTGQQLDVYRIYSDSMGELAAELSPAVFSSLQNKMNETAGLKIVVDPNLNKKDENGNAALPGVIGLMPQKSAAINGMGNIGSIYRAVSGGE